jgi:hypothetical protein
MVEESLGSLPHIPGEEVDVNTPLTGGLGSDQ